MAWREALKLGQSQPQLHSAALSRAIAAALGLGLLLFVLWIALVGNPFEPVALAPAARPVEAAAPVPQPAPEPTPEPLPTTDPAPPPTASDEDSRPGWGCGDKNHEHTGPPGHDGPGPC